MKQNSPDHFKSAKNGNNDNPLYSVHLVAKTCSQFVSIRLIELVNVNWRFITHAVARYVEERKMTWGIYENMSSFGSYLPGVDSSKRRLGETHAPRPQPEITHITLRVRSKGAEANRCSERWARHGWI